MGAIIASSILFSRALMPIDQLVGAWRMLFQTRGAWKRLHDMLAGAPEAQSPMPLLRPTGEITAADLVACAPGSSDPILKGVGFSLAAGESMAVIGPSGAGKSTLAKVVLGIWPTVRGTVRLDGADMAQMDVDRLGEHFGYLPQSVELLPGTIAENIRRLRDDDPDGVIDAAQRAGAHEMILGLPKGYDTVVGARGFGLSGGQLQRVALARALYGRPMIVLLDEPDADLDQTGERGLVNAMELLRREKVTLIVIAHRSFLVQQLDKLLVMNGGQVVKFGTMDEFVSPEAAKSVRVVR